MSYSPVLFPKQRLDKMGYKVRNEYNSFHLLLLFYYRYPIRLLDIVPNMLHNQNICPRRQKICGLQSLARYTLTSKIIWYYMPSVESKRELSAEIYRSEIIYTIILQIITCMDRPLCFHCILLLTKKKKQEGKIIEKETMSCVFYRKKPIINLLNWIFIIQLDLTE